MDANTNTDVIFLDFSKAFDAAPHVFLVGLEQYNNLVIIIMIILEL